jgi:hypothetical protein
MCFSDCSWRRGSEVKQVKYDGFRWEKGEEHGVALHEEYGSIVLVGYHH